MEEKVEEVAKAKAREREQAQVKVREGEVGGQRVLAERRRVLVDTAFVRLVDKERFTSEGSLVLIKNVRSVALR
jgi:hypothetical protein